MEKRSGVGLTEHLLQPSRPRVQVSSRSRIGVVVGTVLAALWLVWPHTISPHHMRTELSVVDRVQQCAIDNLHKDLSFLDPAKPITADEFISRHVRLAQALAASDIDAFVLEPGYTFQYVMSPSVTCLRYSTSALADTKALGTTATPPR